MESIQNIKARQKFIKESKKTLQQLRLSNENYQKVIKLLNKNDDMLIHEFTELGNWDLKKLKTDNFPNSDKIPADFFLYLVAKQLKSISDF